MIAAIWTSLTTLAAFVAFFFVLEYFWPAEPRQDVGRGLWFNARSAAISHTMLAVIGPVAILVPAALQTRLGTGWIDLGLGSPSTWYGSLLALLVWMFILDFFFYWWHRLQHSHWFFWASHRLHHSEEVFNASTVGRIHWVEAFFSPFISAVPVAVLFAPIGGRDLPIISFVGLSVWGYINHANLNISFGPFLTGPLYHRIHHSSLPEHEGKNLAGYFPILDIIFGTYCPARRGEIHPTGLYEGERDTSVIAAHCHAFKVWYHGARDAVRRFTRAASP